MKNAMTTISLRLVGALAAAGALATAGTAAADKTLTGQALADRYATCWQLFNQAQWDEFGKCYAPGSVSTAPGLLDAKGGPAIVEKHARAIKRAMPDVAGELQLTVVSGRNAATISLMRGTHTGPLAGAGGEIPATGKKIGQLVAHAIEAGPSGIATKEWYLQDGATMMAQLGVAKQPARPVMEKGAAERPVVVATGSATEKANLAAARKAYALFNKHDLKVLDVLTDDFVDHDEAAPADIKGRAGEKEHVEGFWKMSSNIKCTTPVLFAAGDYTVAIGQIVGTNDGDIAEMGVKKTGKPFKVDFIEFTRWKDGKTVEQWPFYNSMQLAAQLGLVPPPPAHAAN